MSPDRPDRAGRPERASVSRTRVSAVARYATPWAILAILLMAGFGAWQKLARAGALPIDLWWNDLVGVTRGSLPYAVAVWLADVGGFAGAMVCGAIAAAAFFAMRRPREALSILFALGLGAFGSELTKALVVRGRPSNPVYHSSGSSYPSGHSMGAAALAVSVLLAVAALDYTSAAVVRVAGLLAALWIVGMMWSRTALHVHWITDTIGGALLGAAAAVISYRIWFRPVESSGP